VLFSIGVYYKARMRLFWLKSKLTATNEKAPFDNAFKQKAQDNCLADDRIG